MCENFKNVGKDSFSHCQVVVADFNGGYETAIANFWSSHVL
jgi:hypothetical protein